MRPFEHLFINASAVSAAENDVTVQFLGNTNLLISDGNSHILIDGWFSRPSFLTSKFFTFEPDRDEITRVLERAGITKLDAVIPAHSLFDHAMDSPIVASSSGAQLIGSQSSLNIGRGLNLSEKQMRLAVSGEEMIFGAFTVTLIDTKHYRFPGAAANTVSRHLC
ncbi:MAG: L-ascorbate metabolism protein UlaG (beta-lactamase superfamily) [Pseudoalteromonas tetraodonis]